MQKINLMCKCDFSLLTLSVLGPKGLIGAERVKIFLMAVGIYDDFNMKKPLVSMVFTKTFQRFNIILLNKGVI